MSDRDLQIEAAFLRRVIESIKAEDLDLVVRHAALAIRTDEQKALDPSEPTPACSGCRKSLLAGQNWCESDCACLGAVWCLECWNQHMDRTGAATKAVLALAEGVIACPLATLSEPASWSRAVDVARCFHVPRGSAGAYLLMVTPARLEKAMEHCGD